jgi:aminodeoxyfutalosine deaminase
MGDFIASLPKAELHLHLEGTVDAETLWHLAERYGTPLAAGGREAIDRLYVAGDFSAFLQAFKTVCQHLRSPEDYERITYHALRRLAGQNVRYAEITLSAGVILWKGEDLLSSFEGVEAGYRRAREESGIQVRWIFDAVRQFGPEAGMAVVRKAASLQERGVVAFGMGGDERMAAPELFRDVFACARSQGLRLTAHAGETGGPESVRNSLDVLGAERIGHGLTAVQDPRLVDYLAEKQVPLEICLTSNVRTGCLAELSRHPLRHYFDRGLLLSLNTDDPALFGTDLNREYLLAQKVFGFTKKELTHLAQSSFRAAFLTAAERDSYLAAFHSFECC